MEMFNMKEKIKEILTGIGVIIGSLGFSILEIIFIWGSAVAAVWFGISLILEGSIILGLLVLFIGTPIVLRIASVLFPFWVIFLIISLIVGLIRWIF